MATTASVLNVLFNSKGADVVEGDLRRLGTAIDQVGARFALLGGAGLAGLGMMTNASMQFTSAMANVNSIARLTTAELDAMSAAVLGMATEFGAVPTDLADALYDITSSGVPAAEAMGVLEAATVAAGAGLTNTATSARAITAALNAYGLSADEAGNVSDVLFKIVDSGVITFEALANNMGNTLPIAASLGVAIEELGAAYAQLTLSGIGASQAETQIAALMRSTLNETEALTEAVQEYGYASAEALIRAEGLAGFLTFLIEASGGTAAGLQELVGSAEAVNAALVLTQDGASGFTAMLGEMEGAAQDGAYTLEVFGIQMDNAAGAVRRAQAEIATAAITMGSAFEPLVEGAASAVSGIVAQFNELPASGQAAVSTFVAVSSAASLTLGTVALAIPKILEFRNALAALRASGTMFGLLAGSMGPVALGLGALAAGAVLMTGSFDDTSDATKRLEGSIISLGDVVSNLRLSHMDDQADMVQAFQIQAEGVKNTAEVYRDSQNLIDDAHRESAETGREFWDVLYDLQNAYELSEGGAERLAVAQDKIGAAFTDSRVDHEALSATLTGLAEAFSAGEMTLDQYAEAVIAVSSGLENYRTEADAATEVTTALAVSMDLVAANAGTVGESLTDAAAEAAAARAEFQALTREWIAGMLAATDMADALSQWTFGEHASDAAELANNLTDASGAADSMFNVIVGGTDAIKNNANAILSWADDLIAVRGEWSRLDELVNKGLITGTSGVFGDGSQYAQAQTAYDSIASSVQRINDNLDAVQAIQAPLMAEMTAMTAGYTDQLLAMEPAQQMIALAWMDSATSAQAMELAMLGASAASGELGANGLAAFESMAIGAANANPALAALLVDMQILDEHIDASGNKTYTVNTEGLAGAESEISKLTNSIDALTLAMGGTPPTYEVEVTADTSQADATVRDWATLGYTGGWGTPMVPVDADTGPAAASLNAFEPAPISVPVTLDIAGMGEMAAGGVMGAAQTALGMMANTVTVTVVADTSAVDDALANIAGATIDDKTLIVYGDNTAAFAAINNVNNAVIDDKTLYIYGDNSDAMAAIDAVNNAYIANKTAYIDVITRNSELSLTAHALGGYVKSDLQLVGERGPELVSLPYGSYVHTARQTRDMLGGAGGGTSVNVAFNGNFYGSNRAELDEWAETALVPAIVDALHEERRGQVR